MHPLHDAWHQLPADWSSSEVTPSIGELLKLHATIEQQWLNGDRWITREQFDADVSTTVRAADGSSSQTVSNPMPSIFSRLCVSIALRVSSLAPVLADLYIHEALCATTDFLLPEDDSDSRMPMSDLLVQAELVKWLVPGSLDDPGVAAVFDLDSVASLAGAVAAAPAPSEMRLKQQ